MDNFEPLLVLLAGFFTVSCAIPLPDPFLVTDAVPFLAIRATTTEIAHTASKAQNQENGEGLGFSCDFL